MSNEREFSLISQHLDALDTMERVIESHRLESLSQEFKDLLCEYLCGVRANRCKLEMHKHNLVESLQFVKDMDTFLKSAPEHPHHTPS